MHLVAHPRAASHWRAGGVSTAPFRALIQNPDDKCRNAKINDETTTFPTILEACFN
jgi:hypothetical protein